MAEVSGASLFERLSISGLWKKAARSGARLLARLCHLVPAGRVRQTGVEQGAPEDVDLVLERELGLLAAQERGQGRLEGDLGDAVDLAFEGDVGLDARGRRPQSRVDL